MNIPNCFCLSRGRSGFFDLCEGGSRIADIGVWQGPRRARFYCGPQHSQSTATVVNHKQWSTSSATGYLMSFAPRKTSPSSQRRQRHVPGCGNTLCEGHERREDLVSMSGEVKYPTSLHWKCVTCGLHILAQRTL